jgi:alkylation response protein AidB-like acyl-CoA dehydrogenase
MEMCAMLYELARVDGSIGTFFVAHNNLGMLVIDHLGSEEQKKRMLPEAIAFKKILSFGLTEADNGSDATGLRTEAKKVENGYIINGSKSWIGNATFADYNIVWAKNIFDNNKI